MHRVLFVLCASFLSLFQTGDADAATISVVPSISSVQVGQSFTIDVNVAGLVGGAAPSLGGFDLELSYDAARFAFDSLSFGSNGQSQLDLSGFGTFTLVLPGPAGSLAFSETSFDSVAVLDSQQPGAFTLARLFFTAIQPGQGAISVTSALLSDSIGTALGIDGTLPGASVNVVPLPAAGWLLLSGLGAAGALRRRGRSAALA